MDKRSCGARFHLLQHRFIRSYNSAASPIYSSGRGCAKELQMTIAIVLRQVKICYNFQKNCGFSKTLRIILQGFFREKQPP